MESIFKVGDRVFHIEYGWGSVASVDKRQAYGLDVKFNRNPSNAVSEFTLNGFEFEGARTSLLSFTEYTLQGFTQERPIVLPEVGELCLVRDFKDSVWKARNFKKFTTHFLDDNGERWDYFKRIKILD